MKIFLDSSVIIAALLSETGGSAKILMLCEAGFIHGYISQDVIREVSGVIDRKVHDASPIWDRVLRLSFLKKAAVQKDLFKKSNRIMAYEPDAKILAAAMTQKVDILVTLDIKDFISDVNVAKKSGLTIGTPKTFLEEIWPATFKKD